MDLYSLFEVKGVSVLPRYREYALSLCLCLELDKFHERFLSSRLWPSVKSESQGLWLEDTGNVQMG